MRAQGKAIQFVSRLRGPGPVVLAMDDMAKAGGVVMEPSGQGR